MMIAHKKEFFSGGALLIAFFVVLAVMFMPVFKGHNALEYLDALYNSISKGSAYYIPEIRSVSELLDGSEVDVTLTMGNPDQAVMTATLFAGAGAIVETDGTKLNIQGDLGQILQHCIDDTDDMYHNRGNIVSDRYGYDGKRALYHWWVASHEMDKALKAQKRFKEAKIVALVAQKGIETAYNYYTIEPQKITDRMGIVIFSLLFYVVYTLWYGFAIMFLFEGWGMKLEH